MEIMVYSKGEAVTRKAVSQRGERTVDLKKNYAEVLIDGKIYTLGGVEEASYFQQVAAYVNHKLGELRRQPGFLKQKEDYQLVMLEINMADDYFKAREEADMLRRQNEETERDIYGIKHELINAQMKLETAQNRIKELEDALERAALAGVSRREEELRAREAEALDESGGIARRVRRSTAGSANRIRTAEAPSGDQEDERRHLADDTQDERVVETEAALHVQLDLTEAALSIQPDLAESRPSEDMAEAERSVAPAEEKAEAEEAAAEAEPEAEEAAAEAEPEAEEAAAEPEPEAEESAVPTEEKPEPEPVPSPEPELQTSENLPDKEAEERARRAKEEEEKQKALAAARVATEQLLKSRAMQRQNHLQNRGHQNKKK